MYTNQSWILQDAWKLKASRSKANEWNALISYRYWRKNENKRLPLEIIIILLYTYLFPLIHVGFTSTLFLKMGIIASFLIPKNWENGKQYRKLEASTKKKN